MEQLGNHESNHESNKENGKNVDSLLSGQNSKHINNSNKNAVELRKNKVVADTGGHFNIEEKKNQRRFRDLKCRSVCAADVSMGLVSNRKESWEVSSIFNNNPRNTHKDQSSKDLSDKVTNGDHVTETGESKLVAGPRVNHDPEERKSRRKMRDFKSRSFCGADVSSGLVSKRTNIWEVYDNLEGAKKSSEKKSTDEGSSLNSKDATNTKPDQNFVSQLVAGPRFKDNIEEKKDRRLFRDKMSRSFCASEIGSGLVTKRTELLDFSNNEQSDNKTDNDIDNKSPTSNSNDSEVYCRKSLIDSSNGIFFTGSQQQTCDMDEEKRRKREIRDRRCRSFCSVDVDSGLVAKRKELFGGKFEQKTRTVNGNENGIEEDVPCDKDNSRKNSLSNVNSTDKVTLRTNRSNFNRERPKSFCFGAKESFSKVAHLNNKLNEDNKTHAGLIPVRIENIEIDNDSLVEPAKAEYNMNSNSQVPLRTNRSTFSRDRPKSFCFGAKESTSKVAHLINMANENNRSKKTPVSKCNIEIDETNSADTAYKMENSTDSSSKVTLRTNRSNFNRERPKSFCFGAKDSVSRVAHLINLTKENNGKKDSNSVVNKNIEIENYGSVEPNKKEDIANANDQVTFRTKPFNFNRERPKSFCLSTRDSISKIAYLNDKVIVENEDMITASNGITEIAESTKTKNITNSIGQVTLRTKGSNLTRERPKSFCFGTKESLLKVAHLNNLTSENAISEEDLSRIASSPVVARKGKKMKLPIKKKEKVQNNHSNKEKEDSSISALLSSLDNSINLLNEQIADFQLESIVEKDIPDIKVSVEGNQTSSSSSISDHNDKYVLANGIKRTGSGNDIIETKVSSNKNETKNIESSTPTDCKNNLDLNSDSDIIKNGETMNKHAIAKNNPFGTKTDSLYMNDRKVFSTDLFYSDKNNDLTESNIKRDILQVKSQQNNVDVPTSVTVTDYSTKDVQSIVKLRPKLKHLRDDRPRSMDFSVGMRSIEQNIVQSSYLSNKVSDSESNELDLSRIASTEVLDRNSKKRLTLKKKKRKVNSDEINSNVSIDSKENKKNEPGDEVILTSSHQTLENDITDTNSKSSNAKHSNDSNNTDQINKTLVNTPQITSDYSINGPKSFVKLRPKLKHLENERPKSMDFSYGLNTKEKTLLNSLNHVSDDISQEDESSGSDLSRIASTEVVSTHMKRKLTLKKKKRKSTVKDVNQCSVESVNTDNSSTKLNSSRESSPLNSPKITKNNEIKGEFDIPIITTTNSPLPLQPVCNKTSTNSSLPLQPVYNKTSTNSSLPLQPVCNKTSTNSPLSDCNKTSVDNKYLDNGDHFIPITEKPPKPTKVISRPKLSHLLDDRSKTTDFTLGLSCEEKASLEMHSSCIDSIDINTSGESDLSRIASAEAISRNSKKRLTLKKKKKKSTTNMVENIVQNKEVSDVELSLNGNYSQTDEHKPDIDEKDKRTQILQDLTSLHHYNTSSDNANCKTNSSYSKCTQEIVENNRCKSDTITCDKILDKTSLVQGDKSRTKIDDSILTQNSICNNTTDQNVITQKNSEHGNTNGHLDITHENSQCNGNTKHTNRKIYDVKRDIPIDNPDNVNTTNINDTKSNTEHNNKKMTNDELKYTTNQNKLTTQTTSNKNFLTRDRRRHSVKDIKNIFDRQNSNETSSVVHRQKERNSFPARPRSMDFSFLRNDKSLSFLSRIEKCRDDLKITNV